MPDPQRTALRKATGIGPDPSVPSREGLSGLLNWLASYVVPIYPEQEVGPVNLLAALPPMKGLKAFAAGAKAVTAEGKAAKAAKAVKAADTVADVRRGIRAYHGSPHDFDKFSLEKVGTGEGAQAYGHGLYFAENPGVAEIYRNNLAGFPELKNLKLGDLNVGSHNAFDYNPKGNSIYENVRSSLAEDLLLDQASLTGVPPDQLQAHVLKQLDAKIRDYATEWPEGVKDAQRLRADLARPRAVSLTYGERPGKTYEVNINADPAHFLDLDKKLKDQPANVKAIANDLFRGRLETREIGSGLVDVREKGGGSIGTYPKDKVAEVLANPADYYPYHGRELYEQIANAADARRRGSMPYAERRIAASNTLRQAGVPGARYLDQVSRTPGQGTRNFVVFDDKLIDILRKYGWLPPVAGLTGLSQVGRQPAPEAR